jgi:glycolate dehydrogenase FAD-binding subunit
LPSASEIQSVHEAAGLLAQASAAVQSVSIEREGGQIELRTARLDRLLEHEPGDLTCIVEAGIRLSALQAALEPHGQMLALDPPGDPTVGACVAANLSGPRRHRYGTARDLVIGVTVVLGDGTVANSGGKVVKNVAGYDLGKLLCGSEGRLGLIARVSLRLHPRPEVSRTLAVPVASPDDAARKAQAVLRSGLVPSAVDVHWPGRLALLLEGGGRAVVAQVQTASGLIGAEPSGDEIWAEAAERQQAARGRLSFAPAMLAEVLAGFDEAVVRVGDGVAYVPEPVDDPRDAVELALVERIKAQLDPAGILV